MLDQSNFIITFTVNMGRVVATLEELLPQSSRYCIMHLSM